MRVGLAIEAGVDVADDVVAQTGLLVVPAILHWRGRRLQVGRAEDDLETLLDQPVEHLDAGTRTQAMSVREYRAYLLDEVVCRYDYVFLVSLMQGRTQNFRNAVKAYSLITREITERRHQAGVKGPFALRIVDPGTLTAGAGVLAWELARLIRAGRSPVTLRNRIKTLTGHAQTLGVAPDMAYVRQRLQARGDDSIHWCIAQAGMALKLAPILHTARGRGTRVGLARRFDVACARLFARGTEALDAGLEVPCVNLAYAGALDQIAALPGYEAFAERARQAGLHLMHSRMSPLARFNFGSGALALGYVAQPSATG